MSEEQLTHILNEEQLIHWRCRSRGHHEWVYPEQADRARWTTDVLICARRVNWRGKLVCEVTKIKTVPDEPEPDAVIVRFLTPHGGVMRLAGLPIPMWDVLWFRDGTVCAACGRDVEFSHVGWVHRSGQKEHAVVKVRQEWSGLVGLRGRAWSWGQPAPYGSYPLGKEESDGV